MVLWGNYGEQEIAVIELRHLNMQINAITSNFRLGIIKIKNWYNAGEQLFKALRDFYIYGLTVIGPYSNILSIIKLIKN